jgi:hypothetical protein
MFEVTILSTTHIPNLHDVFCAFLVATGVALGTASPTEAQTEATAAASDTMLTLPDAPELTSSSASNQLSQMQATAAPSPSTQIAHNPLHRSVLPGVQPPPLTVRDKILFGLRNSATPFSAAGWAFSSGYSHLLNNSPNYGTNSEAFAQRLGSAAARGASNSIFSSSIMAPIFHEDPRYYVMGRGHPIAKRTLYAVTRALVTRTDSGHATPNFALLSGNLAGAALTNAYYPPLNRGFGENAKTFGLSIGGSAFGFVVNEFYTDALELVHLKKTSSCSRTKPKESVGGAGQCVGF